MRAVILFVCLFSAFHLEAQEKYYRTHEGRVHFKSEAPLETIEAESDELSGIINPQNRQFAFSIPISSFHGFNSPLQEEHFNENYLHSDIHRKASFQGRIIERIDLLEDGNYRVRAKGVFTIHGVEHVQVVSGTLRIEDSTLQLESRFTVLLSDYDIHIPRIVRQKISQEIEVNVSAQLQYE